MAASGMQSEASLNDSEHFIGFSQSEILIAEEKAKRLAEVHQVTETENLSSSRLDLQ